VSKRLRGLIQIGISALLLTLVLRQVPWLEARAALASISVGWLALAWGLFLLGVVVRAARWQTLLDALDVHRPLRELTVWYFVGGFFNVVLPTGFGGDAVRVAELAQDTNRPGPALNSVLVDRYLGLMVLLAMGLFGALVWPGTASSAVLVLIAALFGIGLSAAWALRRSWWTEWGARRDPLGFVVRTLRVPVLASAVAPYGRRTLIRALVISLLFNALQIGWNMVIATGLGLHLPLVTYLVFVPLTAVALLLPAFGGLGVRELTYVGLFGQVGVPRATALALSLSIYIITVGSGLIGGILYLTGGIRRARSRDLHPSS
jgi:uncharacterized membrane protein YbhN (UPF0104 family)